MRIGGETKLTGIIGHPLTYTLSPAMHNAVFEHLGMNFVYVPLVVSPENLFQALEGVKGLGFVGLNVTMPYKESVLPYVDDIASYARMVGAVNTIHIRDGSLVGYNTDGRGFISSLEQDAAFDPSGKKVVILGAGGGARSVAVSLCLAKAAQITIINRTSERAHALVETITANFAHCATDVLAPDGNGVKKAVAGANLVVNTLPVGLDAAVEVPQAISFVTSKQLVYDIVYKPEETPTLKAAKAKGAKCQNGLGMLVHQGASAFEIWTGRTPPLDVMLAAAHEALSDKPPSERADAETGAEDELAGLLDGAGGGGQV